MPTNVRSMGIDHGDFGVAFAVFKNEKKDDDGNLLLAQACVGFFDGLLAGLNIDGFIIKSHPVKGMQVELPAYIQCFVPEHWERIEAKILLGFVASVQAARQAAEGPPMDASVPEGINFN